MTKDEFLKNMFSNVGESILSSTAIFPMDDSFETKMPLIRILNLDETKISEEGKLILDILENDREAVHHVEFLRFKWKIWALTIIQDIFPGRIYNDFSLDVYNAQYYFYYEGLHLIREFFYVGLNNFLKAADHLLRTILEFNIRQCYFSQKSEETQSFNPVKIYLEKGHCPTNQSMLNSFLPNDSLGKATKVNIQNLLKRLSNSSSHAFNPDNSSRYHGRLHFEYTPDSMVFWIKLDLIITPVVWSYYLLYPMIFQPKNILKKFGFNYPAGLFISELHYNIVKNSLSTEDLNLFKKFSGEQQVVSDLDAFYDSQDDLTLDEITSSWSKEDGVFPETHQLAYLQTIAKVRAMKEVLANHCTLTQQSTEDVPDDFLEKNSSLKFWQQHYQKLKY
ncbi:hypothetical protein ACFS5N_05465 [Mucilaginibacter ximonensis]|uniref:Uncharacterized protein n=1 Tax=Mucilaginibacter ximonensis TaxID=538021 RepID=A0ABW5Y9E2_9SPHI